MDNVLNKNLQRCSEMLHDLNMQLLMAAHVKYDGESVPGEDPLSKACELLQSAIVLVDGEVQHSMTFLLLKANGELSRVDLPIGESSEAFNSRVKKLIGCEYYEVVSIKDGFYFLVDELGKVVDPPKPINPKASLFYPGSLHGDPIVGDVLIGKHGYVDGEPDVVGLDEDELKHFEEMFKIIF